MPSLHPSIDAHHRFIAEECDWGFTRFSELRKLFQVQEGHSRATIEDEAADVSVFVRVLKDPTGVLWHNFVKSVLAFLPRGFLPFVPEKLTILQFIATTLKRKRATWD